MNVKIIIHPKNDYYWNPSTYICENGNYLKSISDDLNAMCDETIYVMNIVSTNVANAISANVMKAASRSSTCKEVRYKMDYYILHAVLLVMILIFIIAIICYRYAKHGSKLKDILLC